MSPLLNPFYRTGVLLNEAGDMYGAVFGGVCQRGGERVMAASATVSVFKESFIIFDPLRYYKY